MLARLRGVSAAAHGTEANTQDAIAPDCVIVFGYDLPGSGVAGGLLRLGYGVERVGGALTRIKDAREGLGEDESIPLGDKVVVAVDFVVGVTNIVVAACDESTQYARGALARFRGKSSSWSVGPPLPKILAEERDQIFALANESAKGENMMFNLKILQRICSALYFQIWSSKRS
ncbi:uncharacterized protein LOC112890585 [Panicum hallii]|uniref:uncharacterized protein LOC112890585 n=1 Tax=Panicum hallii TaxID=206008 RepID=UPI000DF4D2D8|nr:uncharacterized protein LOC112890585 [Panicum hallii]